VSTPGGGNALSADFDIATRDDAAFNTQFTHRFTTVEGIQMHHVLGGPRGNHGFLESLVANKHPRRKP